MRMDFASYKGKIVLVTGHTGFKGTWLTFWLHKLGARVVGLSMQEGLDNRMFFNSIGAGELCANFPRFDGNVCTWFDVSSTIRNPDHRPDLIFHLAAQPLVQESYRFPSLTIETNVMGTANVLDVAHAEKIPVVVVTSDKCYENNEWIYSYRENDRLGGKDPYSASKAMVELMVASFRQSFQMYVATVRAGNVIGGGDFAKDRIVADLYWNKLYKRPTKIRYPKATRPWQHVTEPLGGYLEIGSHLLSEDHDVAAKASDAWNFGPRASYSVEELVHQFQKIDPDIKFEIDPAYWQHEASRLHLAIDKATTALTWRPKFQLEEAVAMTSEWYSAFWNETADHVSLRKIMDRQIDLWSQR